MTSLPRSSLRKAIVIIAKSLATLLSSAPTSLTRLERAKEKARRARENEQLLVCPQFVFRRRRFVPLSASFRVIVV